ncbi:MAG: ABC transporter permease [Phycisphaeraceae bacterium]|nr:ABC transporter permease [Phycisphaeraceae bacterium]
MKAIRVLRYSSLQLRRNATRTLLAMGGIAVAMFLWTIIRSSEEGVRQATELTSRDTRLVVYRQNRYCPFASQLPQSYVHSMARLPGVRSVAPVKIVVSNCRASLDVLTFRGVEPEWVEHDLLPRATLRGGSFEEWRARGDAALIGEELAIRRRLRVGETFRSAGVTAVVAGIFSSADPQDRNSAFVHLPFLQETAKRGGTGGIVTQFTVTVDDASQLEPVASAIDELFQRDQFPTSTTPEKHFVARAAQDIVRLTGFAGWVAFAALIAVFALVANAMALAMQTRVRENAILEVLGFPGLLVAWMTLVEGVMMALVGGAIGAGAAWGVLLFWRPAFSAEGAVVPIEPSLEVVVLGLAASTVVGVLAALVPALRAARLAAAPSLRAS